MKRNADEALSNEFRRVVKEVFEFHSESDVVIEPIALDEATRQLTQDAAQDETLISSAASLDGEDLICSVALLGRGNTIASLAPIEISCFRDWGGELANLLVGALRNHLAAYNVDAQVGIPVSVRGLQLQFIAQPETRDVVALRIGADTVVVVLQHTLAADVQWDYDETVSKSNCTAARVF